jgi:hypothetical protein
MTDSDERPNLGTESYGGTRGYSAGASQDAAYADLVSGITNKTQRYVLIMATQAGERGVTSAELEETGGKLHHGRVSSALTKMHIAGRLVALTERRNHAGVYVLPEHVSGRETRSYRRQLPKRSEGIIAEVLYDHQNNGVDYGYNCACGFIPSKGNTYEQHVAHEIVEALTAP